MLYILGILLVEYTWILVHLHVALWRIELLLLNLHFSKSFLLFLHLFGLFLGFFSCTSLGLLFSLNSPELIEDVLVMQQRVCEFFLESLSLQESGNTFVYLWCLQNFMDCWSLVWVFIEH